MRTIHQIKHLIKNPFLRKVGLQSQNTTNDSSYQESACHYSDKSYNKQNNKINFNNEFGYGPGSSYSTHSFGQSKSLYSINKEDYKVTGFKKGEFYSK